MNRSRHPRSTPPSKTSTAAGAPNPVSISAPQRFSLSAFAPNNPQLSTLNPPSLPRRPISASQRFSFSAFQPRRFSLSAFTLIELITVILIIISLAALSFPAVTGAIERSRKVQAKNELTQIVTAVNAYYTEYGKYPLADVKQGFDTLYGDPGGSYGNNDVFDALRATASSGTSANAGDVLNPRKIVFFTGNTVRLNSKPKGGFTTADTTGANGSAVKKGADVDPWGNTYMIAIDGNYDGSASDFLPYTDLSSSYTTINGFSTVRVPVFAVTFGKDGTQGTSNNKKYNGSDDVISWQ